MDNNYIVTYQDNIKLIGIINQSNSDMLNLVDIDDLGHIDFKATEINPEGQVINFIATHTELIGDCDENNDVNCPGNAQVASFTGKRIN